MIQRLTRALNDYTVHPYSVQIFLVVSIIINWLFDIPSRVKRQTMLYHYLGTLPSHCIGTNTPDTTPAACGQRDNILNVRCLHVLVRARLAPNSASSYWQRLLT